MKNLVILICIVVNIWGGYIPPGPRYTCPKSNIFLHPCECTAESDTGITIKCENTNLAQASVALNNLATLLIPIEKLVLVNCNIGRLFGSLFYNVHARSIEIKDTPIEIIDEYVFNGVNNTLNELYLINLPLKVFPENAIKILGNLTKLEIVGHNFSELPKSAFVGAVNNKLLNLEISNGPLTVIPIESLQPLKKLKTLSLHKNNIQELKKNQFRGLRDVEFVDLSYNNITKLQGDHVSDLIKLGLFNISHNYIKDLPRATFSRNSVLKLLNLSYNKLRKLDSNSFRGMRFLRRLYLSHNEISDVGRETFGTISKIGTIDLAGNRLTKIDFQMFDNLRFIEKIDVSENQVKDIKKNSFRDLYLAEINLSRNNISKIEDGAFQNCVNITILDLSYNDIKGFSPKSFDEISYATELQLSHNQLTVMNQVPLANMNGLKVLNVSYNEITGIPKGTFPKLYELHTIDCSHNNISEIFNAVFQNLFSLRTIDLSYNNLGSIKPGTFGTMPTLLSLNLNYNNLTDIARSALTRLSSMRTLLIRGNNLKSLFQLPISVSHIDVAYNQLEVLPSKLWPSMNSLLSMDLSYNRLGENLEHGTFSHLLTLRDLNLNYNGIKNVPWAALSDLTSLQYLHLEGNELTNLSKRAFGNLPVLFEVNLSLNKLQNVSQNAFEGLLQLLSLNMSHNFISFIPNGGFKSLVSLQRIDLSYNKLERMDNRTHGLLDDCLSLEFLNISHNEITTINKKTFPNDRYIPYKLKEVDMSFNFIPALTNDLAVGGSRFKKLNISNNLVSTIGKGVIENLVELNVFDLSFNKLEDTLEEEIFNISSKNLSELYLHHNNINQLPWSIFKKLKKLSVLDIRSNNFTEFNDDLYKMVKNGTSVYFEGNPLNCDCHVRPIHRFLKQKLEVEDFYRNVKCRRPPYLLDKLLYEIGDEYLTCPKSSNANTTSSEIAELTPDLEIRKIERNSKDLLLRWRVLKNEDIANAQMIIKKRNDPTNIIYEEEIPYTQRKIILAPDKLKDEETELCLLAKDSQNTLRNFYKQQCKLISEILGNGCSKINNLSNLTMCYLLILLAIFK